MFVGCGIYKIGSSKFHQSGFIYLVERKIGVTRREDILKGGTVWLPELLEVGKCSPSQIS